MGKCRRKNKYGFVCGANTAGNAPYCWNCKKIIQLQEEGVWDELQNKILGIEEEE